MPSCKIHNVGFYKLEPRAVYCMSLNAPEGLLAISRSDSSVEIWNLLHTPFIQKYFPPSLDNYSIEGLTWVGARLFSVGLHGLLIEYDLDDLTIKDKFILTGEAGTCISSYANQIACGTELGYINMFSTVKSEVKFDKFLDKQEGRIICIKLVEEFVIGGSINAIRIWNVTTGHAIHKMVLGRSENLKDTIVWCLDVTKDFTIISGDSRGVLTFWDGKKGAQIESYQSHQADITALCMNSQETSLYCAGVDPLICNYEKVKVGPTFKWVKSIQRKIHDHDVRALAFYENRLYSAGIDSYLVCSYHPPKTLIKYAPTMQICANVGTNRILLRYARHVELWSLGQPEKLLQLQKIGRNYANEPEAEGVRCSALSANGKWIFLGTDSGFSLYLFKMPPKLVKIEDLDDSNKQAICAEFNDKFHHLIVAFGGSLVVYDLENDDPYILQRIDKRATMLTVSKCGKYFAIENRTVNVYKHTEDGYSYLATLPKYETPITAFAICHQSVVVAFADNMMWEYSLTAMKLSDLTKQLDAASQWKDRSHSIRNIVFDEENNILLGDDSNIIVIKRQQEKSDQKVKKAKINTDGLQIVNIHRQKHLVHWAVMTPQQFVTVQANPLTLIQKLPPAFAQKTFGTK